MATKKTSSKNPVQEKTIMEKIGDGASFIKDEIVAGKDHIVEIAGDAITSVKTSIQKFTDKKKATPKKIIKRPLKKVAKKAIKKSSKLPLKKVMKKVAVKKAKKASSRK